MSLSKSVFFCILFLVLLSPLVFLIPEALDYDAKLMAHVWTSLIPTAGRNTLFLLLAVSFTTGFFGVGFAFLVTYFEFPARPLLTNLLPVGLAFPGYVLAFLYIEMFDYTGPFQSLLRGLGIGFGFNFRGFSSLVMVLTMALTPYVFLLSRLGFEKQGARLKDVCTSLGVGWFRSTLKILIPANSPWILSGLVIVNMELLSDFGTVSAFQYETFTYAIYRAWFGLFEFSVASQISLLLAFVVIVFLFLKTGLGSSARYTSLDSGESPISRETLPVFWGICASLASLVFLSLSLGLPISRLILLSQRAPFDTRAVIDVMFSTGFIGLLSVMMTVPVAYLFSSQSSAKGLLNRLSGISNFGYAIPGTVLAVGLLLMVQQVKSLIGFESIFVFIFLLAYGHAIRFLNVAAQPIRTGLKKVRSEFRWVAESLGVSYFEFCRRVQLPLLKPSLVAASMFVFIEVIKEMPLTLMMRPYGWDTFSVKVYEFTSEGEWEKAAFPALCIVAMTLLPALVFGRVLKGERA